MKKLRKKRQKDDALSKNIICNCGGIIGLGTITISARTNRIIRDNPPVCSKCGKEYPQGHNADSDIMEALK